MFKRLMAATVAMLIFGSLVTTAIGGEGISVHNYDIMKKFTPDSFAPSGALKPVKLVGAKAGIYGEWFAVSSAGGIKGLKAEATDLKGPGTIPAKQIKIYYGVQDGPSAKRGKPGCIDSLETEVPDTVKKATVIYFKVYVPKDAKAGAYKGAIKITGNGKTVNAPIELKVHDWTVPDPKKWHGHLDIVQSPESVALAYGVKMWSDEHLKLLDQTFSILGEMGQKTLYISAIRRTHFGNEQAIVPFYKDDKGQLQPDFTNAEKYLDVATKHLGKIPGVVFLCWEPIESMGHASGTGTARRTTDKPIQYTLLDKKKGKLRKRTGPAWGTPESQAFWKRFTDGLYPMMEKRGMKESILFGLIGDSRPTGQAMDDICNGLKEPRWAVHSHHYCPNWKGYPVGMGIALWGIHMNICDPKQGRGFGWKAGFWLSYYPREFSLRSSIKEQRYKLEMWSGALSLFEMKHKKTSRYAAGLGRIGGDFWKVLKDGRGRVTSTLAGRYPESYWGQLNLNYCISYIMGKGKKGPLPTVRSEAFRMGSQDLEARVFIEKAIETKDLRAKIGEDLAKKIREKLDDRIRMVNAAGGTRKDHKSGKIVKADLNYLTSNEIIYGLAAEVAAKLGTHTIDSIDTPSQRQIKHLRANIGVPSTRAKPNSNTKWKK